LFILSLISIKEKMNTNVNKTLFYSHLFSILVILAGIVIHFIFGKDIPKILFLLWEFYILYFYGIIVCKKLWKF